MLLAVGLALGGYCALLAWRRPALPPMPATPGPARADVLAAPARLPTGRSDVPLAAAASHAQRATAIAITLRIQQLPASWRTPQCGIAIGTDATRDGLTWVPLPAAEANGDLTLPHVVRNPGPLTVTVAASRAGAVHGYLARRTFDVQGPTTLTLDANAAPVVFRKQRTGQSGGPFRIARLDDPDWVALAGATAGLAGSDGSAPLWLGHGRYELRDPLHPDRRQAFAVPTAGPVEISAALAPLPGDRP